MRKRLLVGCFLPGLVWGQISLSRSTVVWNGSNMIELAPASDGSSARVLDLNGKVILKVPMAAPNGHLLLPHDYQDGVYYASWSFSESTSADGDVRTCEFQSFSDGKWSQVGDFPWPRKPGMKNGLRAIFPLSSGRYLGVSTDPTIKDGNASYVFYKLSLGSNKRFKIEDGLDWGLEAQPFRNGLFALPALERDLLVVHSARIGKWLLIMSPETGIIWIFDSDKAELSRVVEVFSSVDEARLRKNDLMQCITGAQPRSDGDLLISSHSEDYVLKGKMLGPWKENSDLWFKEGAPQEDVDANVRRYFENAGAALRAFPEVLWWRLDPGTGHLAPEQPPLNVPDRIDSTRLLSDFNWRFRPDGSLRFQSEKALQLESQTFLSQSGWTDTQTESSSKAGGHQK